MEREWAQNTESMERPTLALPEMAWMEMELVQQQNVMIQPQSQMDMNLIVLLFGEIKEQNRQSIVQLITMIILCLRAMAILLGLICLGIMLGVRAAL